MFKNISWRKLSIVTVAFCIYAYLLRFLLRWATDIITGSQMIRYLFWLWGIALAILIISLLVIEFQHSSRWMRYVLVSIMFFVAFIIGQTVDLPIWYVFALLLIFHLSILLLIIYKQQLLYHYRDIDIRLFLRKWVRSFVILITLCVWLMLAHSWKTVDIKCDNLYNFFHKAVNIVAIPSLSTIAEEKWWWDNFSQVTIAELFTIDPVHIEKIMEQVGNIDIDVVLSGASVERKSGIIHMLNSWKTLLTKELIEDKGVINKWFCSLVIEQIEKKQRAPLFLYSTTFLLFFLLFPLLNLTYWLITCILYIIVRILFFFGVYSKEKVVGEIEIIH